MCSRQDPLATWLAVLLVGGHYDKFDGYVVLGCSSLGCALTMVVFPLINNVYVLIMVASAMTIGAGSLDTGMIN